MRLQDGGQGEAADDRESGPTCDETLLGLIAALAARADRVLIGISGAVAVGKSTLAGRLAAGLAAGGRRVAVVASDGFLLPNERLVPLGLLDRKGFPETFDRAAMQSFVAAVRSGADPLEVPVYDHSRYDVAAQARVISPVPDVTIVEGVQLPSDLDLRIYLDADEALVVDWYCERFVTLRDAARADPSSFYRRFLSMSDAELDAVARDVWRYVNGPNLHDHIAHQRAGADVVVTKGPAHVIESLEVRDTAAG